MNQLQTAEKSESPKSLTKRWVSEDRHEIQLFGRSGIYDMVTEEEMLRFEWAVRYQPTAEPQDLELAEYRTFTDHSSHQLESWVLEDWSPSVWTPEQTIEALATKIGQRRAKRAVEKMAVDFPAW